MTLTIDLSPDLEQRLNRRSSQVGLPADQFAVQLLTSSLSDTRETKAPLSPEEWQREFDNFGVACGVALSDEALSSEGLYE